MDQSTGPDDARPPGGGRPATSTGLDYATVWESIADHLPEHPAIRQGERVESWAGFDDRSARLAGSLRAHGVRPHDSVGVYLYNRPEFFETYFAAFKIRARPFNVNYRYGGDEFLQLLDIADARALVYDAELRETVAAVADRLPPLRVLIEVGGSPGDAPVRGAVRLEDVVVAAEPAPRIRRAPDDHYLNFTGGTTGLPKGVLVEVGRSLGTAMWSRGTYFGVPGDVAPLDAARQRAAAGTLPSTIPASPLMHSVGFIFSSLPTLITGGAVTLLEHRSFDAHELLRAVERVDAELVAIVGDAFAVPVVRALDQGRPDGLAYDTRSLRTLCTSGVALSAQLKGRLLEHLPDVTIVDACGTTEGVNYGTRRVRRGDALATARFDAAPGLKVLSPDDEILPPGEIGMLAGPTHGRGYFRDPERTAATYRMVGGVLHAVPGDLGRIEADGSFTLIGRGVASINTGGEKVHPSEVEEVIRALPEVDECLVLGVPDERFGECVAALVVLEPGQALEGRAVTDAVRASLAGYKVPRQVRFVEAVPRAPNGKIDYPAALAIAASG